MPLNFDNKTVHFRSDGSYVYSTEEEIELLRDAVDSISATAESEFYNILNYGAVGDDSTDNTAAIQAAIDACYADGGGTVLIPAGIFRTGPVSIDTSAATDGINGVRVTIQGVNKSSSVLKATAGLQDVILTCVGGNYVTPAGSAQQSHLILRDFMLLGDYTAGGVPGQTGLSLNRCVFTAVENINIFNMGTYGAIVFDTDQSSFSNVTIRGNLAGITIGNGTPIVTGANSMVFTDCAISNNTVWGLDCYGLQAVTFIGGSIQYNGSTRGDTANWGMRCTPINGKGYGTLNFMGTIFEGNRGRADLWIDYDDPEFISVNIIGCSWYRAIISSIIFASTNGICLDGNSPYVRLTMSGNTFLDGAGYNDDAAYPWIASPNTNAKIFTDGSDYYRLNEAAGTALEHPVYKDFMHLPSGSGLSFNYNDILITYNPDSLTFSGGTGYSFQQDGAAPQIEALRTDAHGGSATVGIHTFYGKDSAANNQLYAQISGFAIDDVSTSEDGALIFGVTTAGTYADEMLLVGSDLRPFTDDGLALGTGSFKWSDLYLASGSVIDWNNGDLTLTHSANTLSLSGGTLAVPSLQVSGVLVDGAWTAYSPTPTPSSGSYTNVTCVGAYRQVGKTVNWRGTVTFTDVGTGTGYAQITLPNSTTFNGNHTWTAIEWNIDGDVKGIYGANSTTYIRIYTPPGFGGAHANGDTIPFSITYECT